MDERRKRHSLPLLPWRRFTRELLRNDAASLASTTPEEREWIRKKVTPRQALSAYIHHGESFVNMQAVELFWGCNDDDFHHVLLNGRNIRLAQSRPLYLLFEIPRMYLETYAFAWLVWISAQYLFVPLPILDFLFDNIPTVSYFASNKDAEAYSGRCQRLVFERNWFIAQYARLKRWEGVDGTDRFADAATLALKKRDLRWLRFLAERGDLREALCMSVKQSRVTAELSWLLDVGLLVADEETLIALVENYEFVDVLVQRGTYEVPTIRNARILHRRIKDKHVAHANVRKFRKLEDAVEALRK